MTLYEEITSSPNDLLSFIVATQYDRIINRAIGAKVVNSDVGPENLYNALMEIAASDDQNQLAYLLDFQMEPDVDNSPEANAAIAQINNLIAVRPKRQEQRSTPYYCTAQFTGPLSVEQQTHCEELANANQGSNSGQWSAENTNAAFNAFGAIFGFVSNFFGGSDEGTSPGPGNDNNNNNNNQNNNGDTDYMP